MRRLFGCPDIVSLREKFLMARNFYRIFTENNPVMGDSKTFGIPEAKGSSQREHVIFQLKKHRLKPNDSMAVWLQFEMSVTEKVDSCEKLSVLKWD